MDQLIKYGQVKRGVLGVNLYPVTADIAKEFGVSESSGALVAGVQAGLGAPRMAGVKTGDIITSLNGIAKKDPGELRYAIGLLHVGEKVDIGLLRDGKPRTVTAVIAERAEVETANADDINRGLEGADLADSPDGSGVLVKSLQDGQPGGAGRPARQRSHRGRRPHAGDQHQDVPGRREGRERAGAERAARRHRSVDSDPLGSGSCAALLTDMRIKSIVVLGGTGFLGTRLVARLIKDGHQVTVLSRDRERHKHLLVLPGLALENCDVYQEPQLSERFRGKDVVINLIGILNERGFGGAGFRRAHTELTRVVLQAARSAGVERLLQVSALAASPDAPSYYLRSKGEAEKLIREKGAALDWTLFQPSVMFGPGDSFLNLLRGPARIGAVGASAGASQRPLPAGFGRRRGGGAAPLSRRRSLQPPDLSARRPAGLHLARDRGTRRQADRAPALDIRPGRNLRWRAFRGRS